MPPGSRAFPSVMAQQSDPFVEAGGKTAVRTRSGLHFLRGQILSPVVGVPLVPATCRDRVRMKVAGQDVIYPPEPVTYRSVPQRHGGRRTAIHDFAVCICKVVDADLSLPPGDRAREGGACPGGRHDDESVCPRVKGSGGWCYLPCRPSLCGPCRTPNPNAGASRCGPRAFRFAMLSDLRSGRAGTECRRGLRPCRLAPVVLKHRWIFHPCKQPV